MQISPALKKYYNSALVLLVFWGILLILSGSATLISAFFMSPPPAEAAEVVRPPVWLFIISGSVLLILGTSAVTGFFLRKTALGLVLIYVFAAVASFSLLLIPLQLSMPPVSLLILWLPGLSGLWILTVILRLREDQSG